MRPLGHHRDRAAERLDEADVVLDHQDRGAGGDRADQAGGRRGLGLGHAGGRLVQQQQTRLRGEQHADLEPLPLAVAERAGALSTLARQMNPRELVLGRHEVGPGEHRQPPLRPAWQAQILEHAQLVEHCRHLKLAADAGARDPVHRPAGDVLAGKPHPAAAWGERAGDQVEQGRLAAAVRADQGMQRALLEREVDAVDRSEPAERPSQPFDLEQRHGSRLEPVAIPQ